MIELVLAHSPDPDDAFMWWPLFERDGAAPALDTGRFAFRPAAEDIETLNAGAESGTYDITALSCAHYPQVKDRYAITACGASLGDGYGPRLVARAGTTLADLAGGGGVIAIPGERTSAWTALRLALAPEVPAHRVVPFDRILEEVVAGRCAAGLVIHEGQLTHGDAGLELLLDLGAWFRQREGLPLPLGLNVIRRSLETAHGQGTLEAVTALLSRSVRHALAHRERSIEYALRFARDLDAARADRFVEMYVNRWTLDFGPDGRAAVRRFLELAHAAGLGGDPEPLVVVGPTADSG